MRASRLFLSFLLPALSLAQAAPFSSLADFNKSLPACAQAVQDQVFAQGLGMAPYGCSATMDPTDLVKSTNGTLVLCICTASKIPLTAPFTSSTLGSPAFEEVASAACSANDTAIKQLIAESTLFIELCMGLENGTFAGDLSSKNATQPPAAASMASGASWISSLLLAVGAATLVAAGLV